MKKQDFQALVCKCLKLDAGLIERLQINLDVEVSEEAVEEALRHYSRWGHDYKESIQMIIVRHIFQTVIDRYKDRLDERKFVIHMKYDDPDPYLEYDGRRITNFQYLDNIIKEQKEREQDEAQRTAPRDFHLTDDDKKLLLDHGCNPEDLDQIELEANVCRYFLNKPNGNMDRVIERDEAIRLLGRSSWLYGLDRTTFHWSTERDVLRGKRTVSFESGLMGRYHNKYVY